MKIVVYLKQSYMHPDSNNDNTNATCINKVFNEILQQIEYNH